MTTARWLLLLGLLVVLAWGAVVFRVPTRIRYTAANTWQRIKEPPLSPERLGDGGPAGDLLLLDPMGIAIGPGGDVYVSDRGRRLRGRMIWRIDAAGRAHTVAGTGRRGVPAAGQPALAQPLGSPAALAFDGAGRLHFADEEAHRVFRLEPDGRLAVVAGAGRPGIGGDGGPAVDALLNKPVDIRFDGLGRLYIADVENQRIRRVDADGTIATVAGTGEPGSSGDGGPATDARVHDPWGIFVDPGTGDLLIGDSENHVVRRVDAAGVITTIAGTGAPGFGGDGGPAGAAMLNSPQSFAMDAAGRLYIGDEHNNAVRVIAPDGTMGTLIGDGTMGFAADGASGPEARLNDPEGLALLPDGSLLVTDGDNGRVLRVDPRGRVRTFAGRRP